MPSTTKNSLAADAATYIAATVPGVSGTTALNNDQICEALQSLNQMIEDKLAVINPNNKPYPSIKIKT